MADAAGGPAAGSFAAYDVDGILSRSIEIYRLAKPSVAGHWEQCQSVLRGSPHHMTAARCVETHNAFTQCVARVDTPSTQCLTELAAFKKCAAGVAAEFDTRLRSLKVKAERSAAKPAVPEGLGGDGSA